MLQKLSTVYEKQANGTYALVNRNVSSKPLDHIAPLMGKTSLTYKHKIFNTELYPVIQWLETFGPI